MFVYKITNKINGKFYIGKTVSTVEDRFRRHIYSSSTSTTYLHSAIRKYGPQNFEVVVIERAADKKQLCEMEKRWIAELSPPYNLTQGGEGGDTFSLCTEEQRQQRKSNHSAAIKHMWDNMSDDERSRRGRKTQQNTDQVAKGAKIAASRKRLFENETPESKQLRSEKAKAGALKVTRIPCKKCQRPIHPGNINRHEQSCGTRIEPTPRQRHTYTLKSPEGNIISTDSIRVFCNENNLSAHILMKNVGREIATLTKGSSNVTQSTLNTIGWTLINITPVG